MKKILFIFLAVVTTAVFADNTSGQSEQTWSVANNMSQFPSNNMNDVTNNHIYADINLGIMTPIGNGSGFNYGSSIDFGYMFNNNFGIEGGLIGAGNFGDASTQLVNYGAWDVAAKGVLPLSNIFALYGKLGLALGQFSSNTYYANSSGGVSINQQSNNSLGTLIGAGIQFNLSQKWSLHIEDDYIVQFSTPAGYFDPNFMMFGGEFRF